MKKISNKVTMLIIIILAITLITIITVTNHEQINSYIEWTLRADESELLSYVVYDNQDKQNIKILATVNAPNGIEYIKDDTGNIVYGNGKTYLYLDYTIKENVEKNIKIKEKGKSEISKTIIINDDIIADNTLRIEKTAPNVISINYIGGLEGYTVYGKVKDQNDWKNITEPIHLLQLGFNQEEINNSDYKATLSIMIKNEQNKNKIILDKTIDIDIIRIKFHPNGGTGNMEDLAIIVGNTTIKLTENIFTREGYYFLGWSTEAGEEKEVEYTDNITIPIDETRDIITLFAQWREDIYVDLDADGPITLIENYTVPNMTSETTTIANDGTYYAKASTVYTASGRIFGAFDGSANHPCVWHSQLGDANGWTQIKAPYMFQLKDFYLQNRNHSVTYNIHEMKIEASNNEKNWVTIGTYTNPTNDSNAKNHFTVNYNYNNFGYQYYRFTSVSSYSASYTIIGELTLNGNKYSKADTFKNLVRYLNDNRQYINYDEILNVIDYYNNLNETEKQSVSNHYKKLCILKESLLENMIDTSTLNN